ncbi:MAG TPA: UvrD-helicase domain-containing protein [Kiritimatiellia bacterium]|nr:UvrD-helicase domain-containing protein [Kiritimatiellia bacterium]HRU71178.1 UvrD-helicase domain-containing protein [Kiritimatiellia bacterium]
MNPVQNRSISASAGTGKTFRLAHRYIGLMAAGVAPDRICALTFSRKAAGEIFDKIVEHLCAAVTDDGKRIQTANTIAREGLAAPSRADDYLRLLRTLLDNGHRLRIGTLDSFILGVVRAFPLELGVPPETQPMDSDGGEAVAARRAILTRLLDPRSAHGESGQAAFLSDFRLSQHGRASKKLLSVLDQLVKDYHVFYRTHGGAPWRWGDPDSIWPRKERWWEPAPGDPQPPDTLVESLRTLFGESGRPGQLGQSLADFTAAFLSHSSDKPWPQRTDKASRSLLENARNLQPPTLSYYRQEYVLPQPLWDGIRTALRHAIHVEIGRSLTQTQGLRTVLSRYDESYAAAQMHDGHFTFEDLSRLLGSGGPSPSRVPNAENRLYIDYRLDGKLDHWLMDEFQDTSDTQWDTLANLVDEIIQDDARSFFFVGDIKQSIYGWRGGNYRLFNEIQKKYQSCGPRAIASESIQTCHRSLPAIIDAVNRTFDQLADWTPSLGRQAGLRPEAIEAFSRAWTRHESARKDEGLGFVTLLEYDPKKASAEASDDVDDNDDEAPACPAQFEAVAAILKQVAPIQRGLTAAVLVRNNKDGRACVDALRRLLPDMPCVHEGKGGITDNPAVTLLLALVHYAAHPGDTVALRHLQMSPLADACAAISYEILPAHMLHAFQSRGFAATLREWGEKLGRLDAFSQRRLDELLAGAESFDALGICDPDRFEDHIEAYQIRSDAAAGSVRVMTVHQAKGLGFDVVIIPFAPRANSFENPKIPQLLAGSGWILNPPCRPVLEAANGALSEACDAARADANFAQLCVLYVAMTRAQRAMYMLVPTKAKNPTTVSEADLLRERLHSDSVPDAGLAGLTPLYAHGDPDWFRRHQPPATNAQEAPTAPIHIAFEAEITPREPSKDGPDNLTFPAQWLFKAEAGDVRAFGSAIHRLFQKIEWFEDTDLERLIAEWRQESGDSAVLLGDVERQFRACLKNDAVQRALSKPSSEGTAEVWREAPFNLLVKVGGPRQLLSGRFDRLVIERDAAGRPVRATITDFKSNRITTDEQVREAVRVYASQMRDYALAAAQLLGLSPGHITAMLLFTRSGQLAEVRQPDNGGLP